MPGPWPTSPYDPNPARDAPSQEGQAPEVQPPEVQPPEVQPPEVQPPEVQAPEGAATETRAPEGGTLGPPPQTMQAPEPEQVPEPAPVRAADYAARPAQAWPSGPSPDAATGPNQPVPGVANTEQPTRVIGPAPWGQPGGDVPAGVQPTTAVPQPGFATGPTSYQTYPAADPTYRPEPPPMAGPMGPPGPATAIVLPPPVRLPKAESRVALNALGTLVGILLVAGGLELLLRYAPRMRTQAGLDTLPLIWTIVGAVLIGVAALLAAWASWAAIVPGVILAGVSIWAMVTDFATGGAYYIDRGTSWAVPNHAVAAAAANGTGLVIGLLLLAAGIAAVVVRASVRSTIRQQLATMQS